MSQSMMNTTANQSLLDQSSVAKPVATTAESKVSISKLRSRNKKLRNQIKELQQQLDQKSEDQKKIIEDLEAFSV